jgi:hypothetical protein
MLVETMVPPNFATVWGKLETQFLTRLYDLDEPLDWFTPEQYMSFYTLVYEYCVSQDSRATSIQGRELYDALFIFYQALLPKFAAKILESSRSSPAIEPSNGQSNCYITYWERYEAGARHVEAVFHYLDRFMIPREREEGRSILHIYPLLWNNWNNLVLQPVEVGLWAWCTGWLHGERSAGMSIEFNVSVKKIFNSYHSISGIPKDALLMVSEGKARIDIQPFAERLLPWYCAQLERDASELLEVNANLSTVELAKLVGLWWNSEMSRTNHYLEGPSYSMAAIEKKIKDSMKVALLIPILPRLGEMVQGGLSTDEIPTEKVHIGYTLVMLRASLLRQLLPFILTGFYNRLQAKLPRLSANGKAEQLLMLVSMLFAMFQEGRRIIRTACGGDDDDDNDGGVSKGLDSPAILKVSGALDAALFQYIREPSAKAYFTPYLGEFLARWIDRLLRDQAELTEDHAAIPFVLVMLKMLEGGREKFQQHSSLLLARRLLARQAFFDRVAEEALLSPLAAAYGPAFVSHQRRMISDVESSVQLTHNFHNRQKRARLPFELSFQILTSGSWPTPREQPVPWEPRLAECIESFSRSYGEQHSGRILTWSPSLTTAEVAAVIGGRSYSFIVRYWIGTRIS